MEKSLTKKLFRNSTRRLQILGAMFAGLVAVVGFSYYFAVVNPSSAKAFSGAGAGSPEDPFQITTCEELQQVSDSPTSQYVLMNDIDCGMTVDWNNGEGFEPIEDFTATFDGRNFAIQNLYINRPGVENVGLFAELATGGSVLNVKLTKTENNADRKDITGALNVGALVGYVRGNEIKNAHSELNVESTGTSYANPSATLMNVGGLVGFLSTTMSASSSTGTVSVATNDKVGRGVMAGGLVGQLFVIDGGPTNATIQDSFSAGAVESNPEQNAPQGACGGLLGTMSLNLPNSWVRIQNSYSTSSVNCLGPDAPPNTGGLIGTISLDSDVTNAPDIDNSFAAGLVMSPNGHGFFAEFYPGGSPLVPTLTNNAFDVTATGQFTCGNSLAVQLQCPGVNVAGSEPDYFSETNPSGFLNDWDERDSWQLATPYPVHVPRAVRSNPVTNLAASRDGDTYNLTWDPVVGTDGRADNIQYYQIYYKSLTDNNANWVEANQQNHDLATTEAISGLNIPGRYAFRVRAVYKEGTDPDVTYNDQSGIFSVNLEFATGMPATAPTSVQVTPNVYTVGVSWETVDAATAYDVQFRKVGDTDWVTRNSDITELNTRIYQLQELTDYEVRVSAKNIAGNGPWSEPETTRTIEQREYSVSNCQELQDINNDLEGIYNVTNDIDCSSVSDFSVIGGHNKPFLGVFNGQGHTISNVTITEDVSTDNTEVTGIGLFGIVIFGQIKDITLENSTVAGNYLLDLGTDADQNGLPDEPELPGVPDVEFAGEAGVTAQQLGLSTLEFPRFAVGGMAGVFIGSGTTSNIKVLNTTVQGSVAGGVFGVVLPLTNPNKIAEAVGNQNLTPTEALSNFNDDLVLDNLQSSGSINGFVSGGIVGVAISPIGGVVGAGGELAIQNSTSSSVVNTNMGGGILGFGVSANAGRAAATALTTQFTSGEEFQTAMVAAVESMTTETFIVIRNSSSSGKITACDSLSEVRIGALGGIVGIGYGILIDNSHSSSEVSTCSSSTEQRLFYGGVTGGLGGVLLASRIDSSYATGKVSSLRNPEDYDTESNIHVGVTGGLVGLFVSGRYDYDGRGGGYVIEDSYASGDVTIEGKNGLLSVSGGLLGINLGTGTIKNSHASGKITTGTTQDNVGALSISGGLTGITIGLDAPFAYKTGFSFATQNPSLAPSVQAFDIDNSYATGDVVTEKDGKSGILAVTGGMTGLFIGGGNIVNSYASGKVISTIPEQLKIELNNEGKVTFTSPNYGTAISGGMIGSALGADLVGVASTELAGFGIIQTDQITYSEGIDIFNSHASGEVKGNIAGGLIGSAEFETKINKTYAEGDVRGEIVGGLIGQSGFLSLPANFGAGFGASQIASAITSNTTTSDQFKANERTRLGQLFDKGFESIGPVEITNTYATGNITAAPFSVDVTDIVNSNDHPGKVEPLRLPTIAGGIVGFYSVLGGVVKDSYASGNIKVLPLNQTRNERISLADIPSFAGGVFGIDVAAGQPSFKAIITPDNEPTRVDKYMARPAIVENVFSASSLDLSPYTFTGGTSGLFLSPLHVLDEFVIGNNSSELDESKLFVNKNLYMDKQKVIVEGCNGPNDSPLKIAYDLWSKSRLEEKNEQGEFVNKLPPFNEDMVPEQIRERIDRTLSLKTACQYVNSDGKQEAYFKNNKVNAPLDKWNFGDVWVVKKNDYPKFVAGAETSTPNGDPAGPSTPAQPGTALPGLPQPSEVSKVLDELARPKPRSNFATDKYNWLQNLLRSIPPLLAKSIPYLLILIILSLALRYARQALGQYKQLQKYRNNILRILATKSAIDDYLAITTHYLNTPAAVMSGAIELLQSLKKIPPSVGQTLGAKIKTFAAAASKLEAANQVSGSEIANTIKPIQRQKPNPLKERSVWLPSIIALGLLLVANILFMYAGVFNRSWVRIAIEFGCMLLAIFLLGLSYRYRVYIEQNKTMAKQQLEEETAFYQKRLGFIGQAAIVTHDNHLMLEVASNSLKKVTEAKLFFNGLNMLGGIAASLGNLKKFAKVDPNPPLLDVSNLVCKVVNDAKTAADDKKVTVEASIASGILSRIAADEMKQLAGSLLDNAIKFSKEGGNVKLGIARSYSKITLTVTDDGAGISKDKLPSLLKPFTRGTDSMEYNYEGLGLNLYTNKVLLDKLGGKINIESRYGKGTTVVVEIPVQHNAKAVVPMLLAATSSSS